MNAPLNSDLTPWVEENRAYLAAEFARLIALLERNETRAPTPLADRAAAIDRLTGRFYLSVFERDLILLLAGIALDPELAEAWAEVNKGYRTVNFDQAMSALPEAHWSSTAPSRPLRYWRLLSLDPLEDLLAAPLRLDERILHYLVGIDDIDARLRPLVRPLATSRLMAHAHRKVVEQAVAACEAQDTWGLIVSLSGDDREAQEDVAASIATELDLGSAFLVPDAVSADPQERDALAILLSREAMLGDFIYALDGQGPHAVDMVARLEAPVVMINGHASDNLRPNVRLRVDRPDAPGQRALWEEALGKSANTLDGWANEIWYRHRLSARQIERVAEQLKLGDGRIAKLELAAQTAPRDTVSSALMRKIEPRAGWNDLVLPEAQLRVLEQISTHLKFQSKVFETWGFGEKTERGRGIAALFWGSSGTGKSLAAEVIAREQDRDLYRVDLSAVVDKYIGETEKNLRRVFDIGQQTGAVLLFDEADALFGKRSEVKDSHDRYANIGVSYLLSRVEDYTGLALLTTNLKSTLDPAFLRRLRFIVQFPFPDAEERARIWRAVLPAQLPLAEDVDFRKLARLSVAGGVIRNIALNAAFLAAEAEEPVGMAHLFRAAHLDAMKRDTALSETETRGWL